MKYADIPPYEDNGTCYSIDLCIPHYAALDRDGEQGLKIKNRVRRPRSWSVVIMGEGKEKQE